MKLSLHILYFCYLVKHKWYVFKECWKLGIPWLGFIHDWSKFLPSEWMPYARYFYGDYPEWNKIKYPYPWYSYKYTKEGIAESFDVAWLHHQHWNKHHWQHWLLNQDLDEDKVLDIPLKYRKELLADWIGASKTIRGKDANVRDWYKMVREKTKLHPDTREWLEDQMGIPTLNSSPATSRRSNEIVSTILAIFFKSLIKKLFRFVWRHWLNPDDKIVRITSWRSALIDDKCGQRRRTTFCLWFMS